jgi:octopine/nopaline transport system permease protein
MDIDLIQHSIPLLLKGLGTTLGIGVVAVVVGFPLGLGFALARMSSNRTLAGFALLYSMVFRGTPLLVQIFIVYFGLGQVQFLHDQAALWWFFSDGFNCVTLAITLNTAAYTSEILRGGFMAIPPGEIEAARACGMSDWLCLRRIRFPLAFRQALPAYANELTVIIKESSLASTVTVLEITGLAKRLMSETFAVIEVFTLAGLLYLIVNFAVLLVMRFWLEPRLSVHCAVSRPASWFRLARRRA